MKIKFTIIDETLDIRDVKIVNVESWEGQTIPFKYPNISIFFNAKSDTYYIDTDKLPIVSELLRENIMEAIRIYRDQTIDMLYEDKV